MSLSERLSKPSRSKRGLPCPISVVLEKLNDEDRAALEAQMNIDVDDADRLSTMDLMRALHEEGFSIHYKGVERHRSKACRCFIYSTR